MDDNYFAGLMGIEIEGDTLRLRLDLGSDNPAAKHPSPILKLELRGCHQAQQAFDALQLHIGDVHDLWLIEEDGQRILVISNDSGIDPEVRIVYGEAGTSFDQYSLSDLQLKLNGLIATFQVYSARYEQETTRYRQILESLRRDLQRDLDHAAKKAAFFAQSRPDDPIKQARLDAEARAFKRVLDILDRLEKPEIE